MLRTTCAVAATALALAALPTMAATADGSDHARRAKVSLTMPTNLVEGDAFTIQVKVGRNDNAKVVQLQQQVDGARGWQTVGKTKAKHKKKYEFHAVSGAGDTVSYRAKVVYRDSKPVTSEPSMSTVWHWTSLAAFVPYSHTAGVNDNHISSFTLNGAPYHGWFTTGAFKTWESRYTVGRHCNAIRGVAGVRDESADGSTAVVRLLADDVPVYASPTLTPGTAQTFQVALPSMPYRLAVQGQNIGATAPQLPVYPAVGTPELLCTGLGV